MRSGFPLDSRGVTAAVVCDAGAAGSLATTIGILRPILEGWRQYFRKAEVKATFQALDVWIRRKLRTVVWRQWKQPRIRLKQMIRRGIPFADAKRTACSGAGPWRMSKAPTLDRAIPTTELRRLGLVTLVEPQARLAFAT